ncbi:zinc finger, CCHC-type containing protein [Tanacetum coccineum]
MRARMTQRTSSNRLRLSLHLKTPDRRLLELEDQINFLLKGSRPTPRPSSTHTPQAYANAIYLNPHQRNQNEPPKQKPFTFHERTSINPQPQALGTSFEARVRDYMAAHTKMMERFNDSLSGVRVGKMKGNTYNFLPRGLVYEAILRKRITRKEDIGGNFKIPCKIGGLKHMNALIDQGSDVNIMPLSTYMKLTDERPIKTDIRLSLASHSYIYPLGIVEDVLVDVAGYVYHVDFVILGIREDEKRPFILGTPFLTTAKAMIKFDKGTISLRSGKSKISFHRIPKSLGIFFKENPLRSWRRHQDYPDGVIFDKKKLGSS